MKTILVVDDTPENIDMVTSILDCLYKVKAAINGEKALKIARNPAKRPDLVLLDIMMPVMDGIETLKGLKADDETKDIPVVMLSGESDEGKVAECEQLGSSGFLLKPIDTDALKKTVADLLA